MSRIIILFAVLTIMEACEEAAPLADAYGNFETTTTTISAEASGQLLRFDVAEGRKLEKGILVALVDTTQLHLERQKIKATINTLPKKLRNSLADISVLKNQKANLIRERDRVQRLLEKKAAATQQLDDLEGKIEVVDKQVAAMEAQTQINNRSILAEKGPMLAQLDLINEQIRNCYLYNPLKGMVLNKLTEQYEMVNRGAPLYRIGDLDTMTLRFYLDAVQLQTIALGKEVQVLVDNGVDRYTELTGTIYWIAAEAEFTPKTIQTKEDRVNLVYAVKAKVANPDGLLKIGMPAEVNLVRRDLMAENSSTSQNEDQ